MEIIFDIDISFPYNMLSYRRLAIVEKESTCSMANHAKVYRRDERYA